MKIMRKKRDQICEQVAEIAESTKPEYIEEEVARVIDGVFDDLGIAVEPKSPFPDASPGKWTLEGFYPDSTHDHKYWDIKDGRGVDVAHMIGNEADAMIAVNAKALMKGVYRFLKAWSTAGYANSGILKLVLEKMGVDVSELS